MKFLCKQMNSSNWRTYTLSNCKMWSSCSFSCGPTDLFYLNYHTTRESLEGLESSSHSFVHPVSLKSVLSFKCSNCPIFFFERGKCLHHCRHQPPQPRNWINEFFKCGSFCFGASRKLKLHVKWQCFLEWHFCKYTMEVYFVSAIHVVFGHLFLSCLLVTYTVNQILFFNIHTHYMYCWSLSSKG